MTPRETILVALHARLSALPATALRGDVLPERMPVEGLMILRDGEPGAPEVTLSPLRYHYQHRAEIEAVVQGAGCDKRIETCGARFANTANFRGFPHIPGQDAVLRYATKDGGHGVGTWTKIGLNNTDYNDQGAFDAVNNHFVAPVDGTYLFGATLLYKINASATARMRGRLVLNGTTEIRGSLGEISATHVSLATAIWLQTMVPLTAGDTVELQGYFRVADGYFAADHTSFWGCKVG